MSNCHCGSNTEFSSCCEPFLKGDSLPATAEQLLRSRYSAFVEQNIDYIESTIHPKKLHEFERDGIEQWSKQSEWKGLTINRTEAGLQDDAEGIVDFEVRYLANEQEHLHHEVSTFKKVDNRWFFFDGKFINPNTYTREDAKVGRNDPCTCGSGKKFKKCCGKA